MSALRHNPIRVAAVAVVGAAALFSAWPAAAHWMARASNQSWVGQADALGLQIAGSLGLQVRLQPEVVSEGVAVAPIYLNPLRDVSGLVPERVDQGVDFSGSGPVYALGDAVVTNATGASAGGRRRVDHLPAHRWPGSGAEVYVAEDVTPTVVVGQHVTPSTVVGDMFEGGDGIETGWAQPSGAPRSRSSRRPGGRRGGPVPDRGRDQLRRTAQSLGVPAAPNY